MRIKGIDECNAAGRGLMKALNIIGDMVTASLTDHFSFNVFRYVRFSLNHLHSMGRLEPSD